MHDAEITRQLDRIQVHLHALIHTRATEFNVASPDGDALPKIAGLTEDKLWYPVPGMYGGFDLKVTAHGDAVEMMATSWCRVCDGSGQRHAITAAGATLVEAGF